MITLKTKNKDRVQEYAGIIADLGGTMTIEPTPRTPKRKKCWPGKFAARLRPMRESEEKKYRIGKNGNLIRKATPSSYILAGESSGLPDNAAGNQ